MPNFTILKDLANELGIDKSNLRKYILEKVSEVEFIKVRTPETRGQVTLALTIEDAEIVRQTRESAGFTTDKLPVIKNGSGVFYVIQVIPELDPGRVKLGFASGINARLQAHRTVAPTAKIIKTWDCKRTWESAALASATREGCELIASEIFKCDSLDGLIERIDMFFEQMPDIGVNSG